jgi:RNA polymerase sigma-70 factor (ECF subfamily)
MFRVAQPLSFSSKLGNEAPTPESVRFQSEIDAVVPSLRRFALALIGDRDQADDLVEKTLLRALTTKYRYPGGHTQIWLYTLFISQHRRNLLSRWRYVASTLNRKKNLPRDPDIKSALAALSDEQRRALLLVVLEGFSYDDVSDIEGVPVGIMASRIASARARLCA